MKIRVLVAALAALAVGGCQDTLVPDLNNPSTGGLENPTRSQVATLMNGTIIAARTDHASWVLDAEILGRDAYNLDNADPRWVSEMLILLDAGGFGGRHWLFQYQAFRTAKQLATSASGSTALTEGEKAAVVGFAKTLMAYNLIRVYESRGDQGLPVDVGETARDLMPILCEGPALEAIATMLDEGYASLTSADEDFPAELPAGFENFDTPDTFAQFNRALRAKVALYQRDYTGALDALDASFVDTGSPLDLGVYFDYSTAANDLVNGLYQDPATTNYRVHPSVLADAPREGDVLDRRAEEKVAAGTPKEFQGVGSSLVFNVYEGLESPIPIVTNEELILIRAQANIGLESYTEAANDINFIRTTAGGLSARTDLDASNIVDELLVQKRYSLLFTSPSRWVDARFYGKLDELPTDLPSHNVEAVFPIPTAERLARGGDVTCQAAP